MTSAPDSAASPRVLVVGAGPTGLVLAAELLRHGVHCRLVDARPARSDKSRAIGVQARTLELLDLMDMDVAGFLERGNPVRGGRVLGEDGRLLAQVDFSHLPTRHPFMLLLPQDETEALLQRGLERRGGRIERGRRLTACRAHAGGVEVTLQGDGGPEVRTYEWVVGCDGAHSTLRDLLRFDFEGGDYRDAFMLADLDIDGPLDRDSFAVHAAADGPLAFFPLRDGRFRIVADNAPADWTDTPTLAQCQALVDERGPGGLRLRAPRWLSRFRLHHRQVTHLRSGRVFLAGDAAHVHSPAGGQGMNTGMQDAVNLAWKLARVVRGESSEALLDTYEAERLPIDESVVRASDAATRIVSMRNPFLRMVRDHLMPLASGLESVRRHAGALISELGIHYRDGPLAVQVDVPGATLEAGDRMPDLEVTVGEGRRRLYELLRDGELLLLSTATGTLFDAGGAGPAARHLPVGDAAAVDVLGRHSLTLVRPDGYVLAAAPLARAGEILARARQALR